MANPQGHLSGKDHFGIMPIIEVENLIFTHAFSKKPVLNGLSLAVERGSITALIGESGCGKTTLMTALLGLIPEFIKGKMSGRICVAGSQNPREFRKYIEPVFQNPDTQLLSIRVREEIISQLEKNGLRKEARLKACAILDEYGLAHLADRKTDTLAWGEKQRLALACALTPQPSVLLLDEPLSGLDPAGKIKFLNKLKEINRIFGTTILIIEHEIALMQQFSDCLYLFRDGKLEDRTGSLSALDPEYKGCCFDPDTSEYLLEAKGIHHEYSRTFPTLQGIDTALKRKECVAILGPNGAGKSTLVKCLCHLIMPKAGEITISGRNIRHAPRIEITRHLGITFQNPDKQLFAQTVREECLFASNNFGIPIGEAEQSLAFIADALKITGLMDRSPVTLSHGEKKRVALAGALVHRPELLLLDEPVAGLDQWNSERALNLLKSAHHSGTGILFITHDISLVNNLATRVIFMKAGRKTFDGSTRQFFNGDWRSCYLE
jgi:energy-coupling factor transport system ATP-binding protein